MNSLMITNKNVYCVPEFDSDSDSEEYSTSYNINSFINERQEYNLVKLGCSKNMLDDYKKRYLFKNPKSIDKQYDVKFQQYQLQLNKELELIIQIQQQKKEQELKQYQTLMTQITSLSVKEEADRDKAFEEELKKSRNSLNDAIALDKKKLEAKSVEAKEKAKKESKELEEKEKKKQELKEKNDTILKLQKSSATSLDGLEEYKNYYKKIETYKITIQPKLNDDSFRKQCFEARKIIKRTVAQLQSNHDAILEKFNTIHSLLNNIKQQSMDAFEVMLNYLAKIFLQQAKQEIHATPHAAYFLSRFAYLMCSTIPEFIDYLLGRLLKRCPYLIPQYHDDDPNISHDEIRSRLRYCIANKEKKILETFLQHAEGQKCYIMLYGALCQTLPDPGQPANAFPIKHAWIYLARLCNMPPREITPFLIMGLLEVSAKRLLETYPNQTPKLFHLIRETIIPLFPKSNDDGNVSVITRLEMFLDNYFKTGILDCVPESLPSKV